VELDLSAAAFGKQFKRADRSGAAWAVVIGDSEAEQGEVILKNLAAAAEERISVAELQARFA
jgi:histidyl-tRNA synthetase